MPLACTDSVLRSLEADVRALESYKYDLKNIADDWIQDATGFDTGQLSTPAEMTEDVLGNLTESALGCDEDQIPVVEDYIENCLYKVRREITRAIRNLTSEIAETTGDVLTVAERLLCKTLQDLIATFDKYSLNRLLESIDRNIECITSSDEYYRYVDRIDDMNDRINTVLDELPVDSSGNFDFDKLTSTIDSGLKQNLEIYKNQSETVLKNSQANMQKKLADLGDLNPASRF